MKKYKNGFIIKNGSNAEPILDNFFEVPSKEDEEKLIKLMSEDIRKEIDNEINNRENAIQ